MQDLLNAFGFVSEHIHIAGWAFLIIASWKVSAKVTEFLSGMKDTSKKTIESSERIELMESTMNTIATNHLPHLQEGINTMNETLKDLHRDLLAVVLANLHKNE